MKISIPGVVPPSPNELRRRYRHPQAYARLRNDWQILILAGTSLQDRRDLRSWAELERPVAIQVSIYNSREYDPDNLVGCQKPVLDALQNLRFIHSDAAKFVQLKRPVYHFSSRKHIKTEIDIELPQRCDNGLAPTGTGGGL